MSIFELAHFIVSIVGVDCEIVMDRSKPNGTPLKVSDSSKIKSMGWTPSIPLKEGLAQTYAWLLHNRCPNGMPLHLQSHEK